MKIPIWERIAFVLVVLLLALVFGLSLTSCSVLHKNKSISKVDSVSVQKSHVDSSSKIDTVGLHKKQVIVVTNTDTSKSNEHTTIDETTVIKEFDTSGKLIKKTTTKKKTEKTKTNNAGKHDAGLIVNTVDSSSFLNHAEITKDWSDSNSLKKETKSKQVVRQSWPWYVWAGGSLLLLLIIAYIIYRNRNKIKDFIIHKATGL